LPFPIAVAFDHHLIGAVGEAIDGTLRQDGTIGIHSSMVRLLVTRGRGAPVAFEDDFVDVAGLLGIEAPEAEVVDDQDIGGEKPPDGFLGGVIGAGLMEMLEEMIGAPEEDLIASAAAR
jgi:hypothetical protein